MTSLPSVAIFCELQLVHETGYFMPQPSLEECWHQVTDIALLSLSLFLDEYLPASSFPLPFF